MRSLQQASMDAENENNQNRGRMRRSSSSDSSSRRRSVSSDSIHHRTAKSQTGEHVIDIMTKIIESNQQLLVGREKADHLSSKLGKIGKLLERHKTHVASLELDKREQAREIDRLKAALQRSENENARLRAALSPSPTTQQQQQQQPAELMATIAEKDRVIAGLENKLAKLRAIWNECTGRLLSGQQLLSAPLQQSSQPHPAAIASIPAEGAAYGTRTPDRSTNTDAHTSEPRCHERTDVPLHTCATGIRKTRRYRHHPAPSPATLGGQRPSRFFLPDEDEECEGNNTANRRAHQDIEDDIQVSNHHLPLTNEYEAYKNTSESNNEDVMEYEQWVLGLVQDLLDNELKLNHIGNPLELHKVLGGITASMVDQLTKRGQYRVLECLHLAMYHGSPLFNILHDNLPSALRNKFFVLDEDGDEKPGRRRVWWRSYTSYKGGCPDNLKLVGPGDRLKFYLGFGHP